MGRIKTFGSVLVTANQKLERADARDEEEEVGRGVVKPKMIALDSWALISTVHKGLYVSKYLRRPGQDLLDIEAGVQSLHRDHNVFCLLVSFMKKRWTLSYE